MSKIAAFKRDYEGCVALLSEVSSTLSSYPKRHRSLSEYYRDKDMLISIKALLEAIIAECPQTGSRGGAIFLREGKIKEENRYYRDYLSLTKNGGIEFIKASPVPLLQKPFEYYLNKLSEEELL